MEHYVCKNKNIKMSITYIQNGGCSCLFEIVTEEKEKNDLIGAIVHTYFKTNNLIKTEFKTYIYTQEM